MRASSAKYVDGLVFEFSVALAGVKMHIKNELRSGWFSEYESPNLARAFTGASSYPSYVDHVNYTG